MSSLPAGWYKDPADTSTQRYWDGEGWLGKAIPADAVPPDGPPPVEVEPAPVPPVPPPAVVQPQHPAAPPPGWPAPPPGWPQQQHFQAPPPPPPGWHPQAGAQPPHAYFYPIPVAHPHGMALAGLGQRLVARLIDIAVVLVLNIVVNGWFAYQWWRDFHPILTRYMDQVQAGAKPDYPVGTERMATLQMTIILISTLLWLLYEAPAIAGRGQTLGKMMMGIRVVGLDSTEPIGFRRAFGRWAQLGLWSLFWWCLVGFVVQLLDSLSPTFDSRLRQAWHDKAARTVVVAVPDGAQPTVEATPGGDLPGGPR
ncbi:hypothetical protein ACWT_7898 [Actinoplanes sp. SE50]|uniref:RDD family protein n=1 Tax=unclassified Actinoplanes TaxID=2626549 RepID=UPI00023EDFBF|nr:MULTISPECIES: RDD family protein [unclassified Actinoplanes]AEV88907.1 Protein piccolo [Actinoplanes sp. SE50/110]ATO87313.1 hypothetical protein ACWT_7898 [Actinoplanes sp. SE50]SLM04731.1 uncharacterized protein ACSP50_8039 [Actinoplanes sp. SE50/110]